jgi:hypothetical protein
MVAALLSVSGALGCATVGNDFSSRVHSKLVAGKTTEAKAISLVGSKPTNRLTTLANVDPPTWGKQEGDSYLEYTASKVTPERGDYLLEWRHTVTDWFGGEKGKSLVLMFNSQGILKAIVSHDKWDSPP